MPPLIRLSTAGTPAGVPAIDHGVAPRQRREQPTRPGNRALYTTCHYGAGLQVDVTLNTAAAAVHTAVGWRIGCGASHPNLDDGLKPSSHQQCPANTVAPVGLAQLGQVVQLCRIGARSTGSVCALLMAALMITVLVHIMRIISAQPPLRRQYPRRSEAEQARPQPGS